MAFRRQDIPKTTRKSDKGGPRRLYPRYIRDLAPLPKIELAIGYLDEMIGRRRAELSPDVILDLFGDLKLARCLLACLAESYRYRSPDLADLVGEEAAAALAAWDLFTPADLRAHVYAIANRERNGVVADAERADFLAEVAGPLGLSGAQLGELLHLDAERNQILIRVGPRPESADVAARYNALLTLSILRQASSVELTLPGLDASTIDVVCSRDEVAYRKTGPETVRLHGRRGTTGGWAGFGGRLARSAVHLIAACPRMPEGQAIVHLGDEPLAFALDAKAVTPLRPKARAVAGAGGAIQAAALVESVAVRRRKGGGRTNGWTVRRSLEPLVVEGVLAMPELTLVRGEVAVALVPVPPGDRTTALAAVERVAAARPVIALGQTGSTVVPSLPSTDVEDLLDLLEEVASGHGISRSPVAIIGVELDDIGWVQESRLVHLLGPEADLDGRLAPLTVDGEAAYVPGFGLCRIGILDELADRSGGGTLDVPGLRAAVSDRVGVGPHADALTLHLLGQRPLVLSSVPKAAAEHAAAA